MCSQWGCPNKGFCCVAFSGDTITPTQREGEACQIETMDIEGTCIPTGTACEGGTVTNMAQDNCLANLDCCIGTDQCVAMGSTCQADPCPNGAGIQAGCPANTPHCCFGM